VIRGIIGTLVALIALAAQASEPVLRAFARLPAETFASGPPSGAFRGEAGKASATFRGQPVQGLSSIRPARKDGWWLALADNGFGARANSQDFLLRIYRVRPRWATTPGSVGVVDVAREFIQLADPLRKVPFPIVNERTPDRLLTGGDFDPESFVLDEDGTFWIGDEFGPFILHVDAGGRLIDAPFDVPGIRSPDHPRLASADQATVGRSRGFEGMAGPSGALLFAALEAGVAGDAANTTRILEFDRKARHFTGVSYTHAFGWKGGMLTELVLAGRPAQGNLRFVGIERDNEQGATARFKRVVELSLQRTSRAGGRGETVRREILDLLSIANPARLGGFGARFSFPFITPESVWPISADTIIVVNDNNYPAAGGRSPNVADATEFIRVQLPRRIGDH